MSASNKLALLSFDLDTDDKPITLNCQACLNYADSTFVPEASDTPKHLFSNPEYLSFPKKPAPCLFHLVTRVPLVCRAGARCNRLTYYRIAMALRASLLQPIGGTSANHDVQSGLSS